MWGLRLLALILAVAGQVGISGATLTLAHDESSAISHTERSGIDLHHGHNEATCAACTTLSLQATINSIEPPDLKPATSLSVFAPSALYYLAGPQFLPNSCRAPPREA
jgi:hypothetical protein